MICDSSIEFSPLSIGQRDCRAVCRKAVPNLLYESQPILDSEAVNPQRFD